jgi:hypothetical protein
MSSIIVVNAMESEPNVAVNFSAAPIPFYQNKAIIPSNSYLEFGLPSGTVPIKVISANDTTHDLFGGTLTLEDNIVYSFYLSGQSSKARDTLLIKESLPVISDSKIGVRFINLATGSSRVYVNIQGNQTSQKEFSELNYRIPSSFKLYSADAGLNGTYNFEVRDQDSDSLLTTYSLYYTSTKNYAIIINGSTDANASTPVGAFQVNYY